MKVVPRLITRRACPPLGPHPQSAGSCSLRIVVISRGPSPALRRWLRPSPHPRDMSGRESAACVGVAFLLRGTRKSSVKTVAHQPGLWNGASTSPFRGGRERVRGVPALPVVGMLAPTEPAARIVLTDPSADDVIGWLPWTAADSSDRCGVLVPGAFRVMRFEDGDVPHPAREGSSWCRPATGPSSRETIVGIAGSWSVPLEPDVSDNAR